MTKLTTEQIAAREELLDELLDWGATLVGQMLEDNFCEDCPDCRTECEIYDYWGNSAIREVQVCEPGERSCERADEYADLADELERVNLKIEGVKDQLKRDKGVAQMEEKLDKVLDEIYGKAD